MNFSNLFLVIGIVRGIAYATGMTREILKIADSLQKIEEYLGGPLFRDIQKIADNNYYLRFDLEIEREDELREAEAVRRIERAEKSARMREEHYRSRAGEPVRMSTRREKPTFGAWSGKVSLGSKMPDKASDPQQAPTSESPDGSRAEEA